MIKEFLECKISEQNEFRSDFMCSINNIDLESIYIKGIRRSGIKLDTGACGTLIPLRTLGWTNTQIENLVEETYRLNKYAFSVVHGVENNNRQSQNNILRMTLNEIKQFRGLAIKIKAAKIIVGNFEFNNIDLRVTTQTEANILLGMDIMKNWDIHIGQSKITEECMFIACPYDKINDDYLLALESHFGTGTAVNSALVRKLL